MSKRCHFHWNLRTESMPEEHVRRCSVEFGAAWSVFCCDSPLRFLDGEVETASCNCVRKSQSLLREHHTYRAALPLLLTDVSFHTCCFAFPFIICSCYMNTWLEAVSSSSTKLSWFVISTRNSVPHARALFGRKHLISWINFYFYMIVMKWIRINPLKTSGNYVYHLL
jgi:hypothetical protein